MKSNISSSNIDKLNKDSFFSGMVLEEFPLPFFLKGSSLVNGFYEGFKRPGMTLAGIALLGTGGSITVYQLGGIKTSLSGFLFLNNIDAIPDIPFPLERIDKVMIRFDFLPLNLIEYQEENSKLIMDINTPSLSHQELSKPTKSFDPLLLEQFLTEKRPVGEILFEQREDSQPAAPYMKTWVMKNDQPAPPPLYIPLRKQPQLGGHFVKVEIESNDVDGKLYEDSEMMRIEDAEDDHRSVSDTAIEVKKDLQWSNQNRWNDVSKNSFFSFRSKQM